MNKTSTKLAVIALSGRYSKADSPEQLWEKICMGKELNYDYESAEKKERYVYRYSKVDNVENFDYKFFGMTKKEASVIDPQQRVFLECCYEALENAGYSDISKPQDIGVFASCSISSYMFDSLSFHSEIDEYIKLMGNDKDFLAVRTAYRLGLSGPALSFQSACSSSLSALHFACLSIKNNDCKGALVGGVSISYPQEKGYIHKQGGILSSDGFCCPFSENSSGFIKGNGCSVIFIKDYEQALADGDSILAVISATAINNDGRNKIGFTAPSINGHENVIKKCLERASLSIDDIDYVEAHGTGTELGDKIEIKALEKVFSKRKNKLPIGSIKGNIGHLDAAAGMTSLIKGIFMLNRNIIPPIFNNSRNSIFENSIIYVLHERAVAELKNIGISSLGMGGTNCHVILSKYYNEKKESEKRVELPCYVFCISYFRNEDLYEIFQNLKNTVTDENFADYAFTTLVGKQKFLNKIFIVARDKDELIKNINNDNFFFANSDFSFDINIEFIKKVKELFPLFAKTKNDKNSVIETLYEIGIDKNDIKKAIKKNEYNLYDNFRNFMLFMAKQIINGNAVLKKLFECCEFKRIKTWNYPLKKERCMIEPINTNSTRTLQNGEKNYDSLVDMDTIISIWCDELGEKNIGADDYYFELDGDSFTAIQIVERINTCFDVKLNISDFMNNTTPRELLKFISEKMIKTNKSSCINHISLNNNSTTQCFLIHPAGGSTFCYKRLCRYLDSSADIYAIDLPVNYQSINNMEKLAKVYFENIKIYLEKGKKLILGGYSFGGNMAYEIAHLCAEDNIAVNKIILFDAHPPIAYTTVNKDKDADYGTAFRKVAEQTIGTEIPHKYKSTNDIVTYILENKLLGDVEKEDIFGYFDKWIYCHKLLRKYTKRYHLDISCCILRASEKEDPQILSCLNILPLPKREEWRLYFNTIPEFINVEGNHYTLFSDSKLIKKLAKTTKKLIEI